jgi:hypothetical protein
MDLVIRKLVTTVEETRIEGGRAVPAPPRIGVVAAVVANPFAGRFVDDLLPLTRAGVALGHDLATRLVDLLGGAAQVEAYSKAALVGTAGELEHGSAVIHTVTFGDQLRIAADGDAGVASTEKRGTCGEPIDLSIKGKRADDQRPFHQTFTFRIADAPFPDEMVIAVAGATGGRPHARLISRADEKRLLEGA